MVSILFTLVLGTTSSGSSSALGGLVCIGIIVLIIYLAANGDNKPKGYNKVSVEAVRPHK